MLCNMKSGTFTISAVNEDALGYASDCAWVLDGSTGLNGKRLVAEEGSSDAQWYATAFSAFLQRELPASQEPLTELFSRGVAEVWNEFKTKAGGTVERGDVPCVLGTAVRISKGMLEYISVGDCVLLIGLKNGRVREIFDPKLPALDANTLRLGLEISRREGLPLSQCKKLLLPELRRVRMSMNMPEGYISLADDPISVRSAICGELPLNEVEEICMISDGFSQYYDLFHMVPDGAAFLRLAAEHTPEELFERLVIKQREDETLERYPRFKLSDDATIFYGRIN